VFFVFLCFLCFVCFVRRVSLTDDLTAQENETIPSDLKLKTSVKRKPQQSLPEQQKLGHSPDIGRIFEDQTIQHRIQNPVIFSDVTDDELAESVGTIIQSDDAGVQQRQVNSSLNSAHSHVQANEIKEENQPRNSPATIAITKSSRGLAPTHQNASQVTTPKIPQLLSKHLPNSIPSNTSVQRSCSGHSPASSTQRRVDEAYVQQSQSPTSTLNQQHTQRKIFNPSPPTVHRDGPSSSDKKLRNHHQSHEGTKVASHHFLKNRGSEPAIAKVSSSSISTPIRSISLAVSPSAKTSLQNVLQESSQKLENDECESLSITQLDKATKAAARRLAEINNQLELQKPRLRGHSRSFTAYPRPQFVDSKQRGLAPTASNKPRSRSFNFGSEVDYLLETRNDSAVQKHIERTRRTKLKSSKRRQ